jgi:acyl carrier protein
MWRSTLDVSKRLGAILESVFGAAALRLTDSDGPGTVAAWDSVTHLNIILAIEAEFGVAFTVTEIHQLKSIQQLRSRLTLA